jgi:SAM-dependent methyltransferase
LFLIGAAKRLKTGRAVGIDLWQAEDLSGNTPVGTLNNATIEGVADKVEVHTGDARKLPFDDASFDVVACQFGAMFFPDRAHAFGEARRVLRRGGVFIFNVWDRIEENEFANTVTEALAALYPADPPRFMARTPHGYFDRSVIAADLATAGFAGAPTIDTLAARSRAASAQVAALAYCQGTPLRGEISAQSGSGADANLVEATSACAAALATRFGAGPVDGKIQAHIVSIGR